jgi:hypothetical protein
MEFWEVSMWLEAQFQPSQGGGCRGSFLSIPEGIFCRGLPGLSSHTVQTCPMLGDRCWHNDGAILSPSHSSFFIISELQKQNCSPSVWSFSWLVQKKCHQQPFVWVCLGWICQEDWLRVIFSDVVCLSIALVHTKSFTIQFFWDSKAIILWFLL